MIKKNTLRAALLAMLLGMNVCAASAAPAVQVGFSPEGSALQLVLQTIGEARQSIRLMGYDFTSQEIARALVEAKQRGVDVMVVLDEKGNSSNASMMAMKLLVTADIPVRTVSRFKIMHDKVFIVDGQTVETGSFNYTKAAASFNSENAIVLHDVPELAQTYQTHWQSRWDIGKDWPSSY